jgi:UPF0755 protein
VKTLLRLFLVFLVLAAIASGWLWRELSLPYQGFTGQVFLDFPAKTRTSDMADQLAQKGVIGKPWLFLAARALSPHSKLQAGEYEFSKPASAFTVFARIARGDTYYQVLTVPEGHNIFDIEDDLKPLGLFPPGAFLKAARDPSLIRDLDPEAPTLEGYLFPDSYHLNKRSTIQSLLRAMTTRFREQWRELAPAAAAKHRSVHDIVTLASMVEREAKLPEERPLIAGVFAGRLKIGMRLDCDPTTVYAALLENRYRGKIYRSDLDNPNAYNTYQNAGLPPGPIANPGLSSLRAALNPADTKFHYFVAKADGSGGHNFSEDLTGHLAAVARFHETENK